MPIKQQSGKKRCRDYGFIAVLLLLLLFAISVLEANEPSADLLPVAEADPVMVGDSVATVEAGLAILSAGEQQFIENIRSYNESPSRNMLAKIRTYVAEQGDDRERLVRIGRELVVNSETIDLLLDVADYAFRNSDIISLNSLGFSVLRLDASGFWENASIGQQIRFEALVDAILALPENQVHRFTRYTAARAKERIAVPQDELPVQDAQMLHHLTRRQRFEILGTEYNAVQSIGTMARALEYIIGDYLPYIDDLPQPIWVRVELSAARTPPFQLQIEDNGNVGITFFWNDEISMEAVAQGLTWALLQRIAIWRWNIRDEEAVSYWLLSAVAAEIPIQLQAARNQGLVRGIENSAKVLPLVDLLGRRALGNAGIGSDGDAALQSLWFYRYLRDQAPNRKIFGLLVEAFLAEKDAMQVLQRVFPGQLENDDLVQQWWEVGLSSLVHRQQGVVYSMARSNEIIASLNGVTAWWDRQDRRLRGPALLPLREDARWQSAFWRQQRELKLELPRINPIYFNALLSLGQFYDLLLARGGPIEQISAAELRAQTEAVYAQFLEDWAYAQALQQAVEQVLQQENN